MSSLIIIVFSVLLVSVICLIAELNKNKILIKEKEELINEKEKIECFLSKYFLQDINEEKLSQIFLIILNDYTKGKDLPKNFLHLVCKFENCSKLMEGTILIEIDRFAAIIAAECRFPASMSEAIIKRQKLDGLLSELRELKKVTV